MISLTKRLPSHKHIAPIVLALLLSVWMIGCEDTIPPTTETAPPPSGTTGISVGSGGLTSVQAGSASGEASIVVVDQNQLPIISTDHLNSKNVKVEVGTAAGTSGSAARFQVASDDSNGQWTFQEATDISIAFHGGSTGDAISYVLTLDRSGSMSRTDIALMEQSAEDFVRSAGPTDEGAIINFGSDVVIEQPLTTDNNRLIAAIKNPSAGGSTALFDSIGTGVSVAANGNNVRRAVICMTDGGENASTTYTSASSVVTYANRTGVPVYCVGLGLRMGSAAEQSLKDIASGTGGLYYFSPTSADLADLYDKISRALSNSWTISFNSPVTFVSGTTYAIRITVTYAGGIRDSVVLITEA